MWSSLAVPLPVVRLDPYLTCAASPNYVAYRGSRATGPSFVGRRWKLLCLSFGSSLRPSGLLVSSGSPELSRPVRVVFYFERHSRFRTFSPKTCVRCFFSMTFRSIAIITFFFFGWCPGSAITILVGLSK